MRKLVVLIVILAILVLGGYYAMGAITEKTIKRNIATVNKTNGVNAQLVKYNRGWFTSNALLHWQIQVPERQTKNANGEVRIVPAQNLTMDMPLKIYHGPIIFANKTVKFGMGYGSTDILLPDQYQQQFNNYFTAGSTQPKLNLSVLVTYLNNSQIEMMVPSFKLITRQDQGEFDWMGMDSTVNVTPNANRISGDLNIHGMQFKKGDQTAILSGVTSKYNMHNTKIGLYLGHASVTIPSFSVNNRGQRLFELNDFNVNSSSNIEKGLFSLDFKASIDKILTNGKTFGPGNLEIAIRNLDADALGRINQHLNHIQQSTTELEKQQAIFAIIPEMPKLFGRGAEFEISRLNFVTPEGTVDGSLQISLPQGDHNPLTLVQKIQGKAKLRIPVEIVKKAINEANRQKLVAQQTAAQQHVNANPTATTNGETTTATTIQPTNADNPTTQPASNATAQTTQLTNNTAASTPNGDITQQASTLTTTQLNSLVQSGVLTVDGNYYVIEVVLQQGQLQVNGKPFNPDMLKLNFK